MQKKSQPLKESLERNKKESKFQENSKRGKNNRAKGQKFEYEVRKNLEDFGWIVDKWANTVDYEKNKLVPAKRKYNPFLKVLSIGTGFPDFICFKRKADNYEIIGVEVKANGYLDSIEKGMCFWLLENKVFSRILIARKSKNLDLINSKIEYIDFLDKYKKE